jgi:hypothetical protein
MHDNLKEIKDILAKIGITLEAEQPHVSGERFLMAKDKFVLVGGYKDNGKVAVKVSNNPSGERDIAMEKQARDILKSVSFAYDTIVFPNEVYFGKVGGYTIWAIEFIEQEKVFVEHTLEEQFFLILRAFEEQESFHATTYEHLEKVKKIFPILYAQEYSDEFVKSRGSLDDPEIRDTLSNAGIFLSDNKEVINKYANYLTHTDFVPHNFRVRHRKIYMLDCSPEVRTVHFGNKYEGWARFLNYMVIHNPRLERLLSDYVRKNRGEEDYLSLRLMRVYKIGFLLDFYAKSLEKTEGDLRALTQERVAFWHEILKYILEDKDIPDGFVEDYKAKRDKLRSEEEKRRQREFAVA